VTERRRVRVAQAFFDRLDELLDDERGADGTPSSADFLLHDMPGVIDRLAESYESSTVPIAAGSEIRVLITSGHLVEFMAVYAVLDADGVVQIIYLEIGDASEY
jgi:hypothetical protein